MTNKPDPRRGQALLLVTFALIAMCGLLGLAVDLGWSYFVKKSAQASADAAALSAAYYGIGQVGQTQNFPATKYSSGGNACPSGNVNANGCAYAQNQGFAGSASTLSGVTFPPPTVPNLATGSFWVTARAVQVIPQLFSAVLGNSTGISSARATAAVVTEYINGALHTLNRRNDLIVAASGLPQGADIGGTGQIVVPSGLVMSSQSTSAGLGVAVTGPITIVSPGNASGLGASPITDIGDSGTFLDPYRDLPQPILPSQKVLAAPLPTYGVVGGNPANGVYLLGQDGTIQGQYAQSSYTSGNYVAISCPSGGCSPTNPIPASVDNAQITLTQPNTTFSDSTPICYPSTGSTFGCFFFYGGLSIAAGAKMTVGAGEFVMVGGGSSGMDFVAPSGAYLDSLASCSNPSSCATAGVILIMTGTSSPITCGGSGCSNANGDLYPNLGTQIISNSVLVSAATGPTAPMLNFGPVSLLAGADSSSAAVTGLVAKNLPSSLVSNLSNTLVPFDGVVLWQDQANSTIEYTPNTIVQLPGYINTATCSGTIDNPCTKTLPVVGSEGMTLQAPANTGIEGIVYQPRGAFLQTGGGTIQGPIQIITGAISMQGGGTISVTLPPTSAKRRVVALVE